MDHSWRKSDKLTKDGGREAKKFRL
jgi:hypothetical protein